MSKFEEWINKLITRKQASTLCEAAHILQISDKHDDLFYESCKTAGMKEVKPGVLQVGADYQLVRVQSVAKQVEHTIT